jgi:hypothetical protein
MDEGLSSFGYCGTPIHSIEEDVVTFIYGNTLKFVFLKTKKAKHKIGQGRAISSCSFNVKKSLLAFAEKCNNPNIYLFSYPSLSKVGVLKGKIK